MQAPKPTLGLRHVALYVQNLEACRDFYTQIMGMKLDWEPDADNVYLTSTEDNLALHRAKSELVKQGQRLDHIGFALATHEDVDAWHAYMVEQGVTIVAPPKTHRDGARSFYCKDPDGTVIQMICLSFPTS